MSAIAFRSTAGTITNGSIHQISTDVFTDTQVIGLDAGIQVVSTGL